MCRRRSPSVMMPTSRPSRSVMPTQPKPLLDISTMASDMRAPAGDKGRAAPVCMTSRTNLSMAPSRPAGMQEAEVERGEAAAFEQRDGERVAERKLHQRGRGGREIVRAGLARLRQGEHHVRGAAERALRLRRHGDEPDAEAPRIVDQVLELRGLARPRQRHDQVVGRDHAEVAVARLARMHEIGGRAGRGEGRRDLAADVARLAHAGDDQPALGGADAIDRGDERAAEPVADRGRERGDPAGFRIERAQRGGDERAAPSRLLSSSRRWGSAMIALAWVSPWCGRSHSMMRGPRLARRAGGRARRRNLPVTMLPSSQNGVMGVGGGELSKY